MPLQRVGCRIVIALTVFACDGLLADEGGAGRAFVGMQITPYAGLVPPEPGFTFSLDTIHYDGSVGGDREVPIVGQIGLNLHASFNVEALSVVYVWDSAHDSQWNFASAALLPLQQIDTDVTLQVGTHAVAIGQSASGPFDVTLVPLLASYHVSPVEHWSFGVYVAAPTGQYTDGNIANTSLNTWTFSPTVGYTRLFRQGTLEFSALSGIDIYTRNDASNYRNGSMLRLDCALVEHLANGWAFGAVSGALWQVTNDSGPTANLLGGFKGHAFGLGPIVSYTHSVDTHGAVTLSARWLKSFDVYNQLDGNPLLLSVAYTP